MFTGRERVDLHIHTTASDGAWTPEILLEELLKRDIRLFSVTDHDSIDNTKETKELALQKGLAYLPGVEVSSTYQGHLFHILGYGFDICNVRLKELLKYNTELMEKKDDDSIKKLIEEGYNIDFENYLNYERDSTKGGWKALNYLMDKGHCKDSADFFQHLFKVPFPEFPSPDEVIDIIHTAGGYAFVAHPAGNMNKKLNLIDTLTSFKNIGIDGVECYHPEHDADKTKICLTWCCENHLMITGGSDCHGGFIEERQLGMPFLFLRDLSIDLLKEKINSIST